ncbi:ATP-dependent endonuclease [Paenibacillus athensensis]|uniref:Uncharacterized protein n=1 Tax=Paenibacillus athensensis TaxID=1967502 RepID=A0A4Y8PY75_9BACL|nr:AAA family ATPase [Paenibacillus athensensis]MCD1259882.1 ATP-dependent endonuclease [Paenibacillus athensensis]
MYISRVRIKNFRSLQNIDLRLREMNVLIGPNNSGKTSFLEALNFAIGYKSSTPQEDDFYVENASSFDPKTALPIEIVLDFYEGYLSEDRFSETTLQTFDGIIQYEQDLVKEDEEPIKYIRLKYQYGYNSESGKYVETRIFLDFNDNPIIGRSTGVKKEHISFFPYFYLETLRDIKREISNRASYWGKIKRSVDYSSKEKKINRLITMLDKLLLQSEPKLNDLVDKLKDIQKSIKISEESDSIFLQVFSRRTWELLDGLNLYLKTANSNISLPIERHGMGTQNIATLTIFHAYLVLLLPELVENSETTPIIGVEEPEAHVYPHAQRAMFDQLSTMKGQKIISTHSPFVVDQAGIYDYILFSNIGGVSHVRRIPEFKDHFKFKYGLPEVAYEKQAFFGTEDMHLLKRYVQFKNTELLFSSVFLMCEGDSEKIFFEMISQYYLGKSLGRYGVSIISCDGQAYSNILKIASTKALNIPWIIFSDAEVDTKETVREAVFSNGFTGDDFDNNVIFLPDGQDFEKFYIDWLGEEVLISIITKKYGHKALEIFQKAERAKGIELNGKELINEFIDRRKKTNFGEYVAEHIINTRIDLHPELKKVFERVQAITT